MLKALYNLLSKEINPPRNDSVVQENMALQVVKPIEIMPYNVTIVKVDFEGFLGKTKSCPGVLKESTEVATTTLPNNALSQQPGNDQIIRNLHIPTNMPYDLIMLTEKEYCQITYERLSTTRANRIKGKGCKYYKIGGHIRYRLSEVITYINSCSRNSTSQIPDNTLTHADLKKQEELQISQTVQIVNV